MLVPNNDITFSFTGKERDEETGYGYFGARYMDHELMAMWLSVDPMSDKYPSISPYAYCAWNPVKLVDPNGEDIYRLDVSTGSLKLYRKTKDKTDIIIAGSYQGNTFKKTGKSIVFSKEKFADFDNEIKFKFNFKDWNVTICPNGGLIAMCKKKELQNRTKTKTVSFG